MGNTVSFGVMKCPNTSCGDAQMLKPTEFYTLDGWIIWNVSCISKLFRKPRAK